MNCPFCHGPMEKGYLENGRRDIGLIWFPESRKIPALFLATETTVKDDGGIFLSHAKIFSLKRDVPSAWICRNCKKGIFEWKE